MGRKVKITEIAIGNDEIETTCGIGRWRPQCLQPFARPIFFMLNMALVGIVQGMSGSMYFASISTFEKRYGFDSKVSGIILIADNFAEVILNPIVGYLGLRFNRAHLIATGELILAASSFLTAAPYFIYGAVAHDYTEKNSTILSGSIVSNFELCDSRNRLLDECNMNSESKSAQSYVTVWPAVVLLVMGSFMRGIGHTCYVVVGFPFLDDNVSKKNSPLYLSAMQAIRLVGPASGYMLSSFCLRFNENPFVKSNFDRSDPRFIGAWWLAFCICGILLLFASLPMFLFPAQFKDASVDTTKLSRKFQSHGGTKGALKRFVKNPVVMLTVIGNIFRFIGMGGYFMFKPKYIESQYRQSSSTASLITGFASFLPMSIGIMIGGSIIALVRPRPRLIFAFVFAVESAQLFAIGSGLWLGCDTIKLAGFDNSGASSSSASTMSFLMSSCNRDCACSARTFMPICSADGQTTYFSPCAAGCTSFNYQSKILENCACLSADNALFSTSNAIPTVGYCSADLTKCTPNMIKYISAITFGGIISATARTPNSLISLRSVEPMDKSFAIGVAATSLDLLAFIPYPLIFGYIVDNACLIWESKCGKTGNCWLYDNEKFRRSLHIAALTFIIIGSVFDFAVIFFADRVKNFYENENDDDNEEKITRDHSEIDKNRNPKSIEMNNATNENLINEEQAFSLNVYAINSNAVSASSLKCSQI